MPALVRTPTKPTPHSQLQPTDGDSGSDAPVGERSDGPRDLDGHDGSREHAQDDVQPEARKLETLQRRVDTLETEMATTRREAEELRAANAEQDKIINSQRQELEALKKKGGGEQYGKEIGELKKQFREAMEQVSKRGDLQDKKLAQLDEELRKDMDHIRKTMQGAATTATTEDLKRQLNKLDKNFSSRAKEVFDHNVTDVAEGMDQKLAAATRQLNKDIESIEMRQESLGGATAVLMEELKEKTDRTARAFNVVVTIGHFLEQNGAGPLRGAGEERGRGGVGRARRVGVLQAHGGGEETARGGAGGVRGVGAAPRARLRGGAGGGAPLELLRTWSPSSKPSSRRPAQLAAST